MITEQAESPDLPAAFWAVCFTHCVVPLVVCTKLQSVIAAVSCTVIVL